MKEALKAAIRVTIPSRGLQEYLINQLDQPQSVPSATTLNRHRFTLHMGLCLWLQEFNAAMLAEESVGWRTTDGSPQWGYDLILVGATVMLQRHLADAFRHANALCDASLPDADASRITDLLAHMLRIVQGVPIAIGSGRCSMKYRVHAIVHGEKLVQKTWRGAAQSINATFTWTGDLGEKTITRFSRNLMD